MEGRQLGLQFDGTSNKLTVEIKTNYDLREDMREVTPLWIKVLTKSFLEGMRNKKCLMISSVMADRL
jgi:hypothetical protein